MTVKYLNNILGNIYCWFNCCKRSWLILDQIIIFLWKLDHHEPPKKDLGEKKKRPTTNHTTTKLIKIKDHFPTINLPKNESILKYLVCSLTSGSKFWLLLLSIECRQRTWAPSLGSVRYKVLILNLMKREKSIWQVLTAF